MIGMLLRVRYFVIAAAFLCFFVLRRRTGVFDWVFWPLVAFALLIAFSEYLDKKEPQWAQRFKALAALYIAVHTVVFVLVPWAQSQFPEVFDSLRRRQTVTDIEAAVQIEPCLSSVQAVIRKYAVEKERAEGEAIARELRDLVDLQRSGAFGSQHAERERQIRERIGRMARDRAEWQSVLGACNDKAQASSVSPQEQRQPETPTTTAQLKPTAAVVSRPNYLTGAATAGIVVAFGARTDAEIESKVTEALAARSGVFSSAFVRDGIFQQILDGDFRPLETIRLRDTSLLYACEPSTDIRVTTVEREQLHRSEVRIACRRMDLQTRSSRMIAGSGIGIGFDARAAQSQALERAVGDLARQ